MGECGVGEVLDEEYLELESESDVGEVDVDKKRGKAFDLTSPPRDDFYHAPYFTFLANVLNGEFLLVLNGDIPFVLQYQVPTFDTNLVSSYT